MSRLIKTGSIATDRKRLLQAIFLTVTELAKKPSLDSEDARDMASFLALSLAAINESIEKTVAPWEKRDYWLKADQFRREWAWAGFAEEKLKRSVLADDEGGVAAAIAEVVPRLAGVELLKRNKLGTPWRGASAILRAQSARS